ncbi:MAG: DUF5996 family protein [Gemmatimonadota bacterium]
MSEKWPQLPLSEWHDTKDTLHLWMQVVGKVRLALAPMVNHWWQVPLYVSGRGLTTSAMPCGEGAVEITFDFPESVLRVETSWEKSADVSLEPKTVALFYREVLEALSGVGVPVHIWPQAVELPDVIRLDRDEAHHTYDAGAALRFWHLLVQADRVLHEFRGRFLGKCSPVHFWWGSFDLSCTRFSGRKAPEHPGGVPHLADWVTREAYSHECISAGWWPGGDPLSEPVFYAYAYPEPAGCSNAKILPESGGYNSEMREWLLPYEAVRTAADPDALLLAFLQSTYSAAADLGGWDRLALERASRD